MQQKLSSFIEESPIIWGFPARDRQPTVEPLGWVLSIVSAFSKTELSLRRQTGWAANLASLLLTGMTIYSPRKENDD